MHHIELMGLQLPERVSPSIAVTTSYCSLLSTCARFLRAISSSSTTRMRGFRFIMHAP